MLKILEVKAFDRDGLMLIVPDSPYSDRVPIAIGTLHIDVLIKIATQEELEKIPDLECATKNSNLHQNYGCRTSSNRTAR